MTTHDELLEHLGPSRALAIALIASAEGESRDDYDRLWTEIRADDRMVELVVAHLVTVAVALAREVAPTTGQDVGQVLQRQALVLEQMRMRLDDETP